MTKENSSIWFANKTLFVTLLLVLGMGVANAAFTAAPANPPSSNTAEPVNTSAVDQSKAGKLKLGASTAPGATLDVQGNVKIKDGTEGEGKVLTSDANGVATWRTTSGAATSTINGPAFYAQWSPASVVATGWQKLGSPGLGVYATPKFATPAADFNATTGVFKPSVAGKYVLSASNWAGYGLAICKNVTGTQTPATNPTDCPQGYTSPSGGQVTVVMDANGSDVFQVWIYANGSQTIYGGSTGYTYFSGARTGGDVVNTNTAVPGAQGPQGPAGATGATGAAGVSGFTSFPVGSMIMWFGGTSLPSGWATCAGQSTSVGVAPDMGGRVPLGVHLGSYSALWTPSAGYYQYVYSGTQGGRGYPGYYLAQGAPADIGGGGSLSPYLYIEGTTGGQYGTGTGISWVYPPQMPPFTGVTFICKVS